MKKRITLFVAAFMLLLHTFPNLTLHFTLPVQAATFTSSASYANAPYFYGAIQITAPTGSTVDLRSGLYRTLAHDVYDGDISHRIVLPPNYTNITTNTTVTYSVTNSRGQTAAQDVQINFSGTEAVVQRRVYSFPKADIDATEISGLRKSNNHDSQPLGVYLPPNTSVSIRQIGGFGSIRLRGYTAVEGDWPEYSVPVNGSFRIQHGNGVSGRHGVSASNMGRVPMINTPRHDSQHSVIEVTANLSSIGHLDYYHYGDAARIWGNNQENWISSWPSSNMFAVISGRNVSLLVPRNDIPDLRGQTFPSSFREGGHAIPTQLQFQNIDEILNYYTDMHNNFNRWTGYDLYAEVQGNKLVHTKTMVIPSYGGGGWAYYGSDHVGLSNGTNGISGRTVNTGHSVYAYMYNSWTALHEVGHGYDSPIQESKGFSLGEVTNNIISTFYQRSIPFTNVPNRMWLYDFGNTNATHARLEERTLVNANGLFPDGTDDSFRRKLFAMVTMLDATGKGPEVWARTYALDREMMSKGENWPLPDLVAHAAYDIAKVNMIPYLEWIGMYATDSAKAYVYEKSDARMPYYLRRLVATDATAASIRSSQSLLGNWSGVLPGVSGSPQATATISISIDQISRIQGKQIRIMDGANVVATLPITGTTVQVPSLPVGAYYIDLPVTTDGSHIGGYNYLLLREGQTNTVTVYYHAAGNPVAAAREIRFLGGSDVHFSTVNYAPNAANSDGVVSVRSLGVTPHWVNTLPSRYAEAKVGNTTVTWNPVTAAAPAVRNETVSLGDTITCFHHEGNSRGTVFNNITGQRIENFGGSNPVTAIFIVTKYGLFRQGTSETAQLEAYTELFYLYLERAKNAMSLADRINPNKYKDTKAQLIAASQLLSPADKAAFERDNPWLFSDQPILIVYGDVDGNGEINNEDVALLRRYIGASDPSAFTKANPHFNADNADVNGDGVISAADITLLRRYLVAPDKSTVPLGPQP